MWIYKRPIKIPAVSSQVIQQCRLVGVLLIIRINHTILLDLVVGWLEDTILLNLVAVLLNEKSRTGFCSMNDEGDKVLSSRSCTRYFLTNTTSY